MAKEAAAKARSERDTLQRKVTKEWQNFATLNGRHAFVDLMEYIDAQREMYRKYAEERAMPHPNGTGIVAIDNETVAALLQNSRGLNIVKTYIQSRVDMDVAQPKKSTK